MQQTDPDTQPRGFIRQILIMLIGAAIGVIFSIAVAYPILYAQLQENAARIEANKDQIQRLWDAHEFSHQEQEP